MVQAIDFEYMAEAAKSLRADANRYDSMAVLNRNWTSNGGKLMEKQAEALESLFRYVECLKEIQEIKDSIKTEKAAQDRISQMFNI